MVLVPKITGKVVANVPVAGIFVIPTPKDDVVKDPLVTILPLVSKSRMSRRQ